MGSVVLDYLLETSCLLDEARIEEQYAGVPDQELAAALAGYREHCIKNLGVLRQEVPLSARSLNVCAGRERVPLQKVRQGALYLDTLIIDDPLFKAGEQRDQATKVVSDYLGYKHESVDREGLALAAKYVRSLVPMIAAGYVRMLPLSLLNEPTAVKPVYYSPTQFQEVLPEEVYKFFYKRVNVKSLERDPAGGWKVLDDLRPARGIIVRFEGDTSGERLFHLFDFEPVGDGQKSSSGMVKLKSRLYLPDTAPEPEYFKVWVVQSINTASIDLVNETIDRTVLSEWLNARSVSFSPIKFDLISLMMTEHASPQEAVSRLVLEFDVPFLTSLSDSDLMKVRQNEEEFNCFRDELEKRLLGLRGESDPEKLRTKIEEAYHGLAETGVREIERKIRILRKDCFADAVLGVAGLASAIVAGPVGMLGLVMAGAKGYKTYSDYRKATALNPSYVLWRVRPPKH